MTLTEEFARLLEVLGVGTFEETGRAGGTIFLTALPTTPDECIAVARYGAGEADSRLPRDVTDVQFRCRGGAGDTRDAERLAQRVHDELAGISSRALPGGTWLVLAVVQSGPAYIGRDSSGRHEYTVNVRATLRRPTPHRT